MESAERAVLPRAYELKCTLRDIDPPVWRRLRVAGDLTLSRLHDVLQAAFAWENSHLHLFTIGDVEYGIPDPDLGDEDPDVVDDGGVVLDALNLKTGDRFHYLYDFGDSWEIDIAVEAVSGRDPELTRPVCLDGARAAPPDDCGGVPGYENLVAAIGDPKHRDRKELMAWLGGEFDPEAFDVDTVNDDLAAEAYDEAWPLPWIGRAAERMEQARAAAVAPAPTEAQWRALYAAVERYHAARPWRELTNDLNFGLEDPETGLAGYGSIIGNEGDVAGLLVHRGEHGYDSLCHAIGFGDVEPLDMFMAMDCIGATFVSREELDGEEAHRLQELGLRFRGREAWPSVQAFDPGFAPRSVNGVEAGLLTHALDLAARLPALAASQPDLMRETVPEDPLPFFVFAGGEWTVETRHPKLTPETIPAILPERGQLDALRRLPSSEGALEIDFWPVPGTMPAEDGGVAVVPIVVLAADSETGAPLGMDTCSFDGLLRRTVELACRVLGEVRIRPGTVLVRRPELRDLLLPLGEALAFQVELVDALPALRAVQEDLMAQIAQAGFGI